VDLVLSGNFCSILFTGRRSYCVARRGKLVRRGIWTLGMGKSKRTYGVINDQLGNSRRQNGCRVGVGSLRRGGARNRGEENEGNSLYKLELQRSGVSKTGT